MPISNTPERELFPAWSTKQEEGIQRYEDLPTPTILKQTDLFGIPLRSSFTNEDVPDSALQMYINEAISEIEHELNIYILPVTFREKYDYSREMFTHSFAYLKLNNPNVKNVSEVSITFGNNSDDTPNNQKIISFPLEHVHVMPQEGVLQLVPAYGNTFSGFLLSAFSGAHFHAMRATNFSQWPGGITVEYTCGFDNDKIPALLTSLIRSMAAYKLLSSMGPILFSQNSVSIGIDGTSQSVGNPGPQFLSTRMGELEKIIETKKEAAKGYYQRRILVDFF
jgi:hypothetical protein